MTLNILALLGMAFMAGLVMGCESDRRTQRRLRDALHSLRRRYWQSIEEQRLACEHLDDAPGESVFLSN